MPALSCGTLRENAMKVTIRRMSQRKAAYKQITDVDCHVFAYLKY